MIPRMDRLGAGAVDRVWCRAWCGKTYAAIWKGREEGRDYWASPSFSGSDGLRWCSERCRDLRLPPLAPASPANVSPPSPAPGQRWRLRSPKCFWPSREFTVVAADENIVRVAFDDGSDHGFGPLIANIADYLGPASAAPAVHTPAAKPTRTPGITCRHCLLTSAGGVDHQPTCTRNDVLTADSWLTSEAWSTQVRCALERLQDEREKAARPFVPSMLDEDLFGRPVGK